MDNLPRLSTGTSKPPAPETQTVTTSNVNFQSTILEQRQEPTPCQHLCGTWKRKVRDGYISIGRACELALRAVEKRAGRHCAPSVVRTLLSRRASIHSSELGSPSLLTVTSGQADDLSSRSDLSIVGLSAKGLFKPSSSEGEDYYTPRQGRDSMPQSGNPSPPPEYQTETTEEPKLSRIVDNVRGNFHWDEVDESAGSRKAPEVFSSLPNPR
ncbi:hypothetical protein ANO14919_120790 [Xylariales sp. No.14919]|nr:hypothetical protein ANO14919_120790 [Xylariales sp. No.14919]